MKIYPAMDLLQGRVVRLLYGDYENKTVYHHNPMDAVQAFIDQGACRLHVVDLDGARSGQPTSLKTLQNLCENTHLFVQVGGGLRTLEQVQAAFDAGVSRVILGTAALENPSLLDALLVQYGSKIAVGVDAREGKVAVQGWLTTSSMDATSFCKSLTDRAVSTIIYTDIARDGALTGPNLAAYERLLGLPCELIASGGVSSLADIASLASIGVPGVIVGRALYDGRFTLQEAMEVAHDR